MDDETVKRINGQFRESVNKAGPFKKFTVDECCAFDWKTLHGKNLLISVGVDESYSESILVMGTDLKTGKSYVLHQDIKKSW